MGAHGILLIGVVGVHRDALEGSHVLRKHDPACGISVRLGFLIRGYVGMGGARAAGEEDQTGDERREKVGKFHKQGKAGRVFPGGWVILAPFNS
jgi:hypothetical protein